MSEFYFAATGPLMWLKRFETEMECLKWYIPYTLPNGKQEQMIGGGLMEPIQIYRFIAPKESMPYYLRTLLRGRGKVNGISGLPILALRKALNIGPVPEDPSKNDWKDGNIAPVPMDHIQIMPIGYKEDITGIIPGTSVNQEGI